MASLSPRARILAGMKWLIAFLANSAVSDLQFKGRSSGPGVADSYAEKDMYWTTS